MLLILAYNALICKLVSICEVMAVKGFTRKLLSGLLVFSVLIYAFPSATMGAETAWEDRLDAVSRWIGLEPSSVVGKVELSGFTPVLGSGVQMTEEGLLLPVDGAVEFTLDAPREGGYNLVLEYRLETGKVLKNTVSIHWEGGDILACIPALWSDESKTYAKDRYGNEVIPRQVMVEGSHLEYVKAYADLDKSPVSIKLAAGKTRFVLKNNTQPIILKAIYLVSELETPGYGEYLETYAGKTEGSGMVIIEAEDYAMKSDSFVRPANDQNPALYPYKSDSRLLNVIDGYSWREAGQKILWEFEVKTPGFYSIGFRYAQGYKEGMPVFRNIEIDGCLPFEEARCYPFRYTGMDYENNVLMKSGKEPLKVWLDSGKHTIAMEADARPVKEAVDTIRAIIEEINDTGTDIRKLSGSSQDSGRTWDIKQYMPDVENKLEAWANRLDEVYDELWKISGSKPAFALNIQLAAKNLRDLSKEPKKIPSRLSKFSEGSGSAAQLLADLLVELSEQPLSLDRIYIFSGEKLPSANVGFLAKIWEGIKAFARSFLKSSRSYAVSSGKNENELSVWVNRPIQLVETMQQMIDRDFTPESGIKVKLSVMPNEQKLILAGASRTNPDAALGISAHIPYELAIRGAVKDLTEFDDFLPYVGREYNLETLVPFYVDGKIYGVAETQDFFVLAYRKDILQKLGISIPQTWEDVKEIMPELKRHSMNFYVTMAGWSGLKPFYTTSPFIFQNGGSIYSPDGLRTAINSQESIKGFELMTELFSIYSVAQNAPSFYNNFRYGTMPIGMANFGNYVALMNAAPEIAGQWDIAPSPGVKDEKGDIVRYQAAVDRSDIIFSNSSRHEDSWKFLKWWLSKDVQLEFAYTMQTKFGPEYMWNTANMEAFQDLPIPEKHKEVILEQWKWIKEMPRHPAGYMVEREISNAWTDVVMNGRSLRASVDKAALVANREMERKLEEFGYIKDGRVVREYAIPDGDDIRKKVKEAE